jgi:basic membrane protein A
MFNYKQLLLLCYLFTLCRCETFRVVTFYANGIDDFGWTYSHELARSYTEDMLFREGVDVSFVIYQYLTYDNATEIAISEIEQGANMIILTSSGYYESTINTLAYLYPDIPILTLTGSQTANSINLYPRSYQAYFLAGLYCGSVTKTGNVGHLGINPIPISASEVNAFYIGATLANPDVNVKYGFMDVYFDPFLEKYAGKYIVDNWDIDCGVSQLFETNNVWSDNNITVIGHISDMRYIIGENVHFSTLYDWKQQYYNNIVDAINGNFTGGRFVYMGFEEMIKISQFSTIAPFDMRNKIIQYVNILNETKGNNTVFCPPFYDHCLSDFEIISMQNILDGAINPRNFTKSDFIENIIVAYDSVIGIIIQILSCIGICLCISFIILVSLNLRTNTIIGASPLFCYLVLIGAITACVSTFFWLGEQSNITCQMQIWLASLAHSLSFGSLMLKNFRVMYLFNKDSIQIIKITNGDLILKGWLPLLALELIFLIIWTVIDPYSSVFITESPYLNDNQQYISCASKEVWGVAIFLALKGILLVAGIIISYKVRKIRSKDHKETNSIGLTIYNTTLIFILAIFVLVTVPFNVEINVSIVTIAIILVSYGLVLFLFVPKFIRIYKNGDVSSRSNRDEKSRASTFMHARESVTDNL